jgi:hypothetical protein
MATSPSEFSGVGFSVVGGGVPTPEEVAAIAAALEVLLVPQAAPPPPPNRWRWSGRWWQDERLDWRPPRPPTHPSRP